MGLNWGWGDGLGRGIAHGDGEVNTGGGWWRGIVEGMREGMRERRGRGRGPQGGEAESIEVHLIHHVFSLKHIIYIYIFYILIDLGAPASPPLTKHVTSISKPMEFVCLWF